MTEENIYKNFLNMIKKREKKKMEDYLHLYLGCDVFATDTWRNYHLHKTYKLNTALLNDFEVNSKVGKLIFKPILRPLINMTREEHINKFDAWYNVSQVKYPVEDTIIIRQATEIKYLLSKHFDLFGLIDAGLAIDATTYKKKLPIPQKPPKPKGDVQMG